MTYQNLCEKGTKPMGKVLDQSVIPVLRKIPKTARNITFLKTGNFDSFDRSLDTSATILKFDPYMVIFKF